MAENRPPVDRRRFFRHTAVAASALSLNAASYGNVAGSNERIRIGFLGCGGRAQAQIDLVNRFAKDGKPVAPAAVCDVWDGLDDEYDVTFGGTTARRRYSQGLFPSAKKCGFEPGDRERVTKDYRRVLEDKDVDAVCIATPDHWHARMAIDAMLAGKDVIVEKPMTRTAEEATAFLDTWMRTGRVVTVGVQAMADPVWVRAFDAIRTGAIGHVAHAQTGIFRNDIRGQWRFYRLANEMNRKTIDWDLFLGHQFEVNGERIGPTPREAPFDRASFAQWRCNRLFSGGPLTDLLAHPVTRLTAAMGVRYPARVTAGGGLYLEYDGRDVPDVASVIADYEEGCQLSVTASTITGYPVEEVIRGRLGTIRFVKGGYQLFRDDPSRSAAFPTRIEKPMEPSEVLMVESPKNETESLWENFLDCIRQRQTSTFSPPDLAAAVVAFSAMAEKSYRTGRAYFWDRERRVVTEENASWVERWEKRSRTHGTPNQVFGWSAGDRGSTVEPPSHQKLARPDDV